MASIQAINDVKRKAQEKFHHERVVKLSSTFFPSSAYHADFKSMLNKLLKFNSAKQMGLLPPSWINMCTFEREFFMVEMEVCLKVLECATPRELVNPYKCKFGDAVAALITEAAGGTDGNVDFYKSDEEILKEYNEIEYPKVVAIVKEMRDMYHKIDKQLSEPIAKKINSDCKIALQLPIGTDIKFVQTPLHG